MKTINTLAGSIKKWVNDRRLRWMLARIEVRLNTLKAVKQA